MITTTTTPSAPLLAGLGELLAKARVPRRTLTGLRSDDRDRGRLLADLRALPDAPADIAFRVRV